MLTKSFRRWNVDNYFRKVNICRKKHQILLELLIWDEWIVLDVFVLDSVFVQSKLGEKRHSYTLVAQIRNRKEAFEKGHTDRVLQLCNQLRVCANFTTKRRMRACITVLSSWEISSAVLPDGRGSQCSVSKFDMSSTYETLFFTPV